MPKLSSAVPKYSHHKQRDLAFVRLDGKQRMLGRYGAPESRQKYDRLIAIWIENGRKLPDDWEHKLGLLSANHALREKTNRKPQTTPTDDVPVQTTVGEVIAHYIPYAREYYEANRTYEQILQLCKLLRRVHERTAVTEFGPKELHELRNAWVIGGWGRKHTNDMAARLIAIFRWAAEKSASRDSPLCVPISVWHTLKTMRGLPKARPLFTYEGTVVVDENGVPIIPEEGKVPPPIDEETVARTIQHMAEVPADMVRFQQATGCRPGEVCDIRPCDVDRSRSEVWIYRPPKHKTRHTESDDGRVVAIGKQAQLILTPYLDRGEDQPCFSPRESQQRTLEARSKNRKTPRSCGNVPGSNRVAKPKRQAGVSYSVAAYNKAIRRAIEKENAEAAESEMEPIEHWSANQLRKAYALKIRYEEGLGLDHSQVVLGHKQRATTEKWYARNQADAKAIEVALKIG